MTKDAPVASRPRRAVMIALGCVCVALGVVGIFVPGLPTTIFLLGASCLFAQSSPTLHRRLMEHPWLGAYIRMAHGRSMPLRAKLVSLALMWSAILLGSFATAQVGPALTIAICLLGVIGTAALLFWVRTESVPG